MQLVLNATARNKTEMAAMLDQIKRDVENGVVKPGRHQDENGNIKIINILEESRIKD